MLGGMEWMDGWVYPLTTYLGAYVCVCTLLEVSHSDLILRVGGSSLVWSTCVWFYYLSVYLSHYM